VNLIVDRITACKKLDYDDTKKFSPDDFLVICKAGIEYHA